MAQPATLGGTIADRLGGVVVGAGVVLTGETGPARVTRTSQAGAFVFEAVRPGPYTLLVTSRGFAPWSQVVRLTGDRTGLTITLDVAGISETVGVVGAGVSPMSVPAPTATRLGLTPLDTPASLSIVTGETIRQRGDMTVEDAGVRMVGITSQAAPGNGGASRMSRGFGGVNSLMTLYDGAQLFVASGALTFPFDTWSVERLEFLGGPASVMYGNGAVGGVINVIPRRPNRFTTENAARVALGTDNTWRAAFGRGGPLNDRAAYRFDVSHNRSNWWVDQGASNSTALSGSVSLAATPRLDITLSEDFGYQEPQRYFGSPLINGRLDRSLRAQNYNVSDADVSFKDNWTQVKADWRPRRNLVVRNNVNVLTSNRYWKDVETYTYLPATNLINRTDFIETYHDQLQVGEHAEATLSTSLGWRTHTTSFGFGYSWTRFQHTNNSPYGGANAVPLGLPDPGLFLNLAGTSRDFRARQDQSAVFVEDRIALNPRWSIVGGLRMDHYDVTRLAQRTNTTASRTFTPVNWRGGFVYTLIPEFSVYGQYATATDAVGTLLTLSPAQQFFDLTPGRQVEMGMKQSLPNDLGDWTFAVYHIVKEKLLVPDPNNPTLRQQIGQQSSRGAEFAGSMNVGHGLRFDANVAYLDAKYDDFTELANGVLMQWAGHTPINVPEHVTSLWLSWNRPQLFQVQFGMRYFSARYLNNVNTATTLPATVADAGIRRQLTDSVNVDLRATNVFDTFYLQDVSGSPIPVRGRFGAPRAVELTMNARF
ncbi:MAG: TonB-dependent siderophore receptor [Acidobacteria bacterium]|nr:TonB-dependent siderophore receptor [Acidobacteriota bacterium]